MWKDAVIAYFKVVYQNWPGGTKNIEHRTQNTSTRGTATYGSIRY
jgi:hypothetical protein